MFKQITHESLFYPIAVIKIKKKEKTTKTYLVLFG